MAQIVLNTQLAPQRAPTATLEACAGVAARRAPVTRQGSPGRRSGLHRRRGREGDALLFFIPCSAYLRLPELRGATSGWARAPGRTRLDLAHKGHLVRRGGWPAAGPASCGVSD
jgi:hypothetical protein